MTRRVVALFSLAATLIAPAALQAQDLVEAGEPAEPFSLGVQIAGDGLFNEPALMPQASLLFHVRLDREWSARLLAGYAYAPGLDQGTVRAGEPGEPTSIVPWRQRHMIELRPSAGYSINPAVEARGFLTFRYVGVARGMGPAYVDTGPTTEPILVAPGYQLWQEHYWFGGGTEWLFRPESTRRLELGVSLGIGGRTLVNPDGSVGLAPELLVHAGASLGWLFF